MGSTFSCPLCGSTLSAERFSAVIRQHRGMERQLERLKVAEQRANTELARAKERARELAVRASARAKKALEQERRRTADRLKKHQESAKRLRAKIDELEDRLKRGETPQTEGLLEERALLAFLKQNFPADRFDHVGKGGDIIHDVCTDGGERCGRILYEVKRVLQWSSSHVLQASVARASREADIAVLVTNRFPARRQHYFVERDVLVISPLAILPVVHTAREGLLHAFALTASGEKKKQAMKAVYDYLAGAAYTGHIKKVAQHFSDLETLFHKEVDAHRKMWGHRLDHYRGVLAGVSTIHEKLRGLISPAVGKQGAQLAEARVLLPVFGTSLGIKALPQR